MLGPSQECVRFSSLCNQLSNPSASWGYTASQSLYTVRSLQENGELDQARCWRSGNRTPKGFQAHSCLAPR